MEEEGNLKMPKNRNNKSTAGEKIERVNFESWDPTQKKTEPMNVL